MKEVVSPEPAESQLPLAQKNPHAKVTHVGKGSFWTPTHSPNLSSCSAAISPIFIHSLCNSQSGLLFWFLFVFFFSLGPHLLHREVPRLGVASELQPYATATATAIQDPSSIRDLHCSFQQSWILNTQTEARGWLCVFMDTSQVLNLLSHNRNSQSDLLKARIRLCCHLPRFPIRTC